MPIPAAARGRPARASPAKGFTLIELLAVIAVIGILAALLLPALSRSKNAVRKTACINNSRQINLAMRMYADEHGDAIRARTNKEPIYFTYKESILPYLSRSGTTATNDPIFTCPSDDFDCSLDAIQEAFLFDHVKGIGFRSLKETSYSSYFFNGLAPDEVETRVAGKPFSSVREPSRLILIGEISGFIGLSTHDRKQPQQFNNAKNIISFVDGHVACIPIYWNGRTGLDNMPCFYDPPAGYAYTWLGR